MKALFLSLTVLILSSSALVSQKLYIQQDLNSKLSTELASLSSDLTNIEDYHQQRTTGENINRTETVKRVHMIVGRCKGMTNQAKNAEQISADMLTKFMMYENELEEMLKGLPEGGYYNFESTDALTLENLTNTLISQKQQMKNNGYRFHAGLDNAEENLVLLRSFEKTYKKYLNLLERAYVEL